MTGQTPAPTNIHFHKASQRLQLSWPGGVLIELDARALRGACLCSGCSAAKLQSLFVLPPDVRLLEVRMMGVCGLQLIFSDGHNRGVFPWQYLRELSSDDTALKSQ